MNERTDTRTRIQEVALELFTEQGYEGTSLREIAERLGVTKAALYYHFKSKEDIVSSFMDDRVAATDELIEWLRQQPRTPQTRLAFVERYLTHLNIGQFSKVMRFFEQNQAALKGHPAGLKMRDRLMTILGMLVPPDASPERRLRIALSMFAIHVSGMILQDVSDDERAAAALAVASDLVSFDGSSLDDGDQVALLDDVALVDRELGHRAV